VYWLTLIVEAGEHQKIPFFTTKGMTYFFIIIFLVCYAGIMSGLTVGFMGIDQLDLKIKQETGSDLVKSQARAILPVLHNHHMLLSTILLNNAIAMETLPIYLDALVPSWAAIFISTTLVLIFGEVVPQVKIYQYA
jgi:metal transporter CNNM